jgi:hypothetical protein
MGLFKRLQRALGRAEPVGRKLEFQATSLFPAEATRPGEAAPTELSAASRAWLASLPRRVRPVLLGSRHPRVANQLALCWQDYKLTERVLSSLILDQRGGRQGFSAPVLAELMDLREYHADRRKGDDDDADSLWEDSAMAIVDR